VDAQEGLLEDVLGERLVAEETREERVDLVLVALVQGTEGSRARGAPAERQADELAVVPRVDRHRGHGPMHRWTTEPATKSGHEKTWFVPSERRVRLSAWTPS